MAVPGDAGDTGINMQWHGEGLMVLDVFVSDGQMWFHIFAAGANCHFQDLHCRHGELLQMAQCRGNPAPQHVSGWCNNPHRECSAGLPQ